MRRFCLFVLGVICAVSIWSARAHALDVTCIEASKYKYLYQLFGNDRAKLAAYLQLESTRLPGPEHCRAALVTGAITLNSGDVERLIDIILRNQGWLADLYLASSGGSVAEGMRLGFVVRAFWLKTHAVTLPRNRALSYGPDFAVVPIGPGPARDAATSTDQVPTVDGWRAYFAAVSAIPPVTPPVLSCASACGLMQTAGIDRLGDVFVHRPRFMTKDTPPSQKDASPMQRDAVPGKGPADRATPPPPPRPTIDTSRSMADTDQGLRRSEALNVAFYQQMDAGADFIRSFQSTSTLVTTPSTPSRFPRFVSDYLGAKCETDPEQLMKLDIQLRIAIDELAGRSFGVPITTNPLRGSLVSVRERRRKAEQCVAAAHEKERLAAFDKQCSRGCDMAGVVAMTHARLRELRERADR